MNVDQKIADIARDRNPKTSPLINTDENRAIRTSGHRKGKILPRIDADQKIADIAVIADIARDRKKPIAADLRRWSRIRKIW